MLIKKICEDLKLGKYRKGIMKTTYQKSGNYKFG